MFYQVSACNSNDHNFVIVSVLLPPVSKGFLVNKSYEKDGSLF